MLINEYYQGKQIYYKMNRARGNAILSLVGNNGQGLILDIGCATGELGEAIRDELGYRVWGIDVSDNFCQIAAKKLDKVFCLDVTSGLENWPETIKTEKFDKIILSEILEHLFFPESLLSKVRHLADDKTEVIITVPNILFWKNRLKIFFGKFDYSDQGLMDRGHIHFFSWKSLNRMLKSAGFRIVETSHFVPTRGTRWLGKILPGLFAFQFILKVKLNEN